MKGTIKISLMPSPGMHSKVFSVSLHILCDLLAIPHLPFLNIHSINWLGVETTGLSIAFHASPVWPLHANDQHKLLLEAN